MKLSNKVTAGLALTAIVASGCYLWRFSHPKHAGYTGSGSSYVRKLPPKLLRDASFRIMHIVGEEQVRVEELDFLPPRAVFVRGWIMELDLQTGNILSLADSRHDWGVSMAESRYLEDSPDIPPESVRLAKMKRTLRSFGVPDPVEKQPTRFVHAPERIVFYGTFHSQAAKADFGVCYDFQLDKVHDVRLEGKISNPDFRMFPEIQPRVSALDK